MFRVDDAPAFVFKPAGQTSMSANEIVARLRQQVQDKHTELLIAKQRITKLDDRCHALENELQDVAQELQETSDKQSWLLRMRDAELANAVQQVRKLTQERDVLRDERPSTPDDRPDSLALRQRVRQLEEELALYYEWYQREQSKVVVAWQVAMSRDEDDKIAYMSNALSKMTLDKKALEQSNAELRNDLALTLGSASQRDAEAAELRHTVVQQQRTLQRVLEEQSSIQQGGDGEAAQVAALRKKLAQSQQKIVDLERAMERGRHAFAESEAAAELLRKQHLSAHDRHMEGLQAAAAHIQDLEDVLEDKCRGEAELQAAVLDLRDQLQEMEGALLNKVKVNDMLQRDILGLREQVMAVSQASEFLLNPEHPEHVNREARPNGMWKLT